MRDLSSIVQGELVNQDLVEGLHNANIHIYSPLHEIPVADGHFDSAICNAVLEHVANPVEVVREIHRVLKPGDTSTYAFLSCSQSTSILPTSSATQRTGCGNSSLTKALRS